MCRGGVMQDPIKQAGDPAKFNKFIHRLQIRISLNRPRFILYTILRILVFAVMIFSFVKGEYENAALCVLALVLFLLPSLAEESLRIQIPAPFEMIIYLFIYGSCVLGEIQEFYILIPGWDTLLHTMNGFLCAAVGFSMVDLLNQKSSRVNLSPAYVTIAAFCFSVTIGVLWEFIEFSMDWTYGMNMQKNTILHSLVLAGGELPGSSGTVAIRHIVKTVLVDGSGREYVVAGYPDMGLVDTMKDLFVNLLGAVGFSLLGYQYIYRRESGDSNIASLLIWRRISKEEQRELEEKVTEKEGSTLLEMEARTVKHLVRRNTPRVRSFDKKQEREKLRADAVVTAWIAVAVAVAELFMLFPMGIRIFDIVLLISLFAMIAGLIWFLFGRRKRIGLNIWTSACIVTSAVTVLEWPNVPPENSVQMMMLILSIAADIILPVLLWAFSRKLMASRGGQSAERGKAEKKKARSR